MVFRAVLAVPFSALGRDKLRLPNASNPPNSYRKDLTWAMPMVRQKITQQKEQKITFQQKL